MLVGTHALQWQPPGMLRLPALVLLLLLVRLLLLQLLLLQLMMMILPLLLFSAWPVPQVRFIGSRQAQERSMSSNEEGIYSCRCDTLVAELYRC